MQMAIMKPLMPFLNRHQTQVFSYIMRIVRNRDLANDIFQETFVKAITTIRQGRYTDAGKFGAWVNRIAHNLVIDFYRQEKSENTTSTDEGEWIYSTVQI